MLKKSIIVGGLPRIGQVQLVSRHDYPGDHRNIFRGKFSGGAVANLAPVDGDFYVRKPGWIAMDTEISPDGKSLYYVNARFAGDPWPAEADIGVAEAAGPAGPGRFRRGPQHHA